MEERDRIDIIATLHDRFNKPADEIIRKMERLEDQAGETGESIDRLEDSLDEEARTTRDNSKAIEQNTKERGRQEKAVDDVSAAVAQSTKNTRANTSAVQESLRPTRRATEAQKDASKVAEELLEVTRASVEAVDGHTQATRASRRSIEASARAVGRARDSLGRFIKTTEDATESTDKHRRATEQLRDERGRFTKATENDRAEWKKWDRQIRKITGGIGKRFRPVGAFLQNYFKIISAFRAMLFSDIGAAIPQLITMIVALGAAFNASLAPIGRFLGSFVQILPLMAAYGQTLAVVKIATKGVSDALKVLNDENATWEEIQKAQQEAGANTWEMAKAVQRLADDFKPLTKAVRETFLEGMAPAVESLVDTYMPTLRRELTRTAEIMNGELRRGIEGLQSPQSQETIADVMERSSEASGLFVDILFSLLDVFLELSDAAGPAMLETLDAIDSRLDQFADWIRDNKDALEDFFLRANDTAGNFFKSVGFIMMGLYGISKAAEPLTEALYGGNKLESWAERMNDPAAQEQMRQNYEDMIPNLEAIGNLVGSIIDGAKEIATSEFFAPLINDLADNGIPMIVEYLKALDEEVGPPLIRIGEAFDNIDPEVMTTLLAPLGDLLGILATVLELVIPLFTKLPEPMQKVVFYGMGLVAMGLPTVFMLLAGPLMFIIKNFDELQKIWKKLKDSKLGKFIGGLVDDFKKLFKPISDFIKKFVPKGGGGGILGMLFKKGTGKAILAVLGPVGAVIGVLWLLWDIIKLVWDNSEAFRDFMGGVWDWIKGAWDSSIDWIVNTAVPWVVDAFTTVWDKIKEVGSAIADFYNEWIKPVIDAIMEVGKIVAITIVTFIILPFKLFYNIVAPIIASIVEWFMENLPGALDWLGEKFSGIWNWIVDTFWWVVDGFASGFQTLWEDLQWLGGHIWTGITAIGGFFAWLGRSVWDILKWIGSGFVWLWEAAQSAWGWIKDNIIGPFVTWFMDTVWPLIKTVIDWIVWGFNALRIGIGIAWNWIKDHIIAPVVAWFMEYIWPTLDSGISNIKDKFDWLKDGISNVWNAIKNAIVNTYNDHISPLFDKLKEGVDAVKNAFSVAGEAIAEVWNDIKEKAKVPIGFVIDNVYNEGIMPVWNQLADVVNLGKDKRLKEVTWAKDAYDTGGYTGPGSKYQPAGVVHADEFVIKKTSQRSLRRDAPGLLDALNDHGSRALGYDSGGWVKPFRGNYSINSGYGMRNGRLHAGVDYPTPSGTALTAVSDGQIVQRGYNSAAGQKISMSTDMRGIVAGYHHLSRYAARLGQMVTKNQVVGYSGNTGRSTGPHLHFSIKKDGRYVNPTPYLQGSGAAGTGAGGDGGGGMANPFDGMLSNLLGKIPGAGGFKDLAVGATKSMVNAASEKAMEYIGVMDLGSSGAHLGGQIGTAIRGAAGTARWTNMARKALQHTGDFSMGNLNSLLRRMNQESGGNPQAINNWDSNARRGTPSKGLMQVIQPTFSAHRDRSLSSNIYDPMANIVASINYTKSRYRSLQSGWNRAGGYFSGGLVDHMRFMGGPVETWGNTLVGELGPEMFLPSMGGPASLVGLDGPEVMSFDREGSILPHQAVAALSEVNDAPSRGGDNYEEVNYNLELTFAGRQEPGDVKREVKEAIAEIERKRKERR